MLTEKSIQRLKPGPRRVQRPDDEVTGFGVRVEPNGRKSFYWYVKAAGKPLFRALGEVGSVSLKEARDEARELAGKLSAWRKAKYAGENPFAKPKKILPPTASPTFKAMMDAYIERHLKETANRPDRAEYNLRNRLKNVTDWFERPIDSITKRDVLAVKNKMLEAYKEKKKRATHGGKYQVNRVIEDIRAAYNWAGGKDEEKDELNFWPVTENPAKGIAIKKKKNERDTFLQPRERFLQPDELLRVYQEIKKEPSADLRDFVTLSLSTGARKESILSAKWTDVHLDLNLWHLPLTKTKAYDIELTPAAYKVFEQRLEERADGEAFVFPADSKSGHRIDIKKQWQRFRKKLGIADVRIHDLRRSHGSYMAMSGASLLQIGKALGHADGSTATQVYARLHQAAVTEARLAGEQKMAELMAAAKKRMKLTEKRTKLLPASA